MSRARESARSCVGRGTRSWVGGDGPSALGELGRRFTQFRMKHPRGTRIPGDLREAALAVLRQQVPPGDLYRACGVSFRQVMAWKAAKAERAELPDVRVFSVVDEEPVLESTAPATEPALELRLGPWSVSVRLAGPGPAGRG
jgi:hypothetical protein